MRDVMAATPPRMHRGANEKASAKQGVSAFAHARCASTLRRIAPVQRRTISCRSVTSSRIDML
jgi:hypothetical protein